MNRKLITAVTIIIVMVATPVMAFQYTGGIGYLHTNSALVLPPGSLDISMYMRGYVSVFNDNIGTISNGSSALSASFGFSRHTEISFTQVLYQDLNLTRQNESVQTNIPGDTYIRFKWGGYQLSDKIYGGFMPMLQYRVAKSHDVQLEPYSSEAIQVELVGLASYYDKPLYPEEGFSAHANLSYTHYNDSSVKGNPAQSLSFLLSGFYPRKNQFGFGAELHGSFFVQRPSIDYLGREDWIYITPFVRYDLFLGLKFIMGLDVLLVGSEETSDPNWIGPRLNDYPNYAPWRITGRINFMPSTSFFAAPTFEKASEGGSVLSAGRTRGSLRRKAAADGASSVDRQAMFKWAIEERGGEIEAVELDLDKIRQERQKAEEELEKLKTQLEKEKTK